MDIDENTLVFFTNGSNCSNATIGDHHTAPGFDTSVGDSWKMWQNIARQDPSFGHPDEFLKDPELTQWESATLTTLDEEIIPYMEAICKRDVRSGKVATGGIVTARDSGWLMSWTVNRQPHFKVQPKDQCVVWIYGLYTSRMGDYVKKRMRDCTGEEIAREWLYHIGVPVERIDELAAKSCNCVPVMMPRVTTYFICRGFAQISRLSDAILIPAVTVLCFVGSYAIHRNLSDVVVMLIFGGLGYLMRKFDLNNAAVVLALILGPISEKGLRGALRVSDGDIGCLFTSPVSWVLIILSIVGIFSPILMAKFEKKVTGEDEFVTES